MRARCNDRLPEIGVLVFLEIGVLVFLQPQHSNLEAADLPWHYRILKRFL
jgi:hypothetical protein